MIRKLVSILFAVVFVFSMGVQVNATKNEGKIRIWLDAGELPVTNGALTLYQVGTPVEGGYRLADSFGGGMVKEADATSDYLAQWLTETTGKTGKTLLLDVDGNATFSNLEEGLYLIEQTERMDGFYPIPSFLAVISAENHWEVHAEPKTEPIIADNPQTGQPFAPLLGAMGLVLSGVGLYLCVDSRRKK